MARGSKDPEKIVTTVQVNRLMYNLISQRNVSPSELLDMAMAAYLEIDLEQELKYEAILAMKRRLQTNDLNLLRAQQARAEQQMLGVYNKIEEENQLRRRIAQTLNQAVKGDGFRARILREVQDHEFDSIYLNDIVHALHKALPDIHEDTLREQVIQTILNGWQPVLLDVPA